MKIFIEGTPVFRNQNIPKAGIGYYTENIYKSLLRLDNNNNYTLFGLYFFGRTTDFKGDFPDSTKYRLIRYIPGKVWNVANRKGLLPPIELLMGASPDLLIYTNFRRYPQFGKAKTFVVVHDIAFAKYPNTVNSKNQKYLEKYVPRSLKKSDVIVTVSEFTKEEIVKYYGTDPDKIIVTHNAVDTTKFKPTLDPERLKKRYEIAGDYILFMGTIEPRKNIERLVYAYGQLPTKIKSKYTFVLAGGKGWLDEGIEKAINKASNGRIIRTGYVDEEDMSALYSGADLFVFPSLYEGFGIPVLESMACDTAVLTSSSSSLPEVGGDAAYYVDEKSIDSISQGIERLLTDTKLRNELIKKGRKRIKKFSWEDSARVLLEEINKLTA